MSPRRPPPRGMALINALVIVVAIAAVSTALLMRAETGRQRLAVLLAADQAALHLDAAAYLAARLLASGDAQAPTHRGQPWAQPRRDEPIDRATVGWRIDDLQGRFNLNWLNREDMLGDRARGALAALARGQGMDGTQAARLADALAPDESRRAGAWSGGTSRPAPLPLILPQALRPVPGLAGAGFDRLLPFLAALPSDSALNVNTVTPEVLGAFLPRLPAPALATLDQRRRAGPFADVDDFIDLLEPFLDDDGIEVLELLPLDTRSRAFEARLEARLDSVVLRRSVILRRPDGDGSAQVVLSLPETE